MESDHRGYHRISTECPALYRVVDSNRKEDVRGIWGRMVHHAPISDFDGMEGSYRQNDHIDPFVLDLFLRLEWRVNCLVKMMTEKEDQALFPYRAAIVDISASGMKIYGAEAHTEGSHLEFQFVLPIIPFREMLLTGKAVWVISKELPGNSEFKYEIGIEFESIKELDREHLIHYVVKRDLQLRQGSNLPRRRTPD
ncbi:MAG: PilZ domain-containing protein [Nitrospiria bacterium]